MYSWCQAWMASRLWPVTTITSVMPQDCAARMERSSKGTPSTGSNGLAAVRVRVRSPRPAARMTACIRDGSFVSILEKGESQAAAGAGRPGECSSESLTTVRSQSASGDLVFGRCAGDEGVDAGVCLIVSHLDRRMLAEVGGWRIQHTTLATQQGQLGTTDHVNRHTCRVGRILD